MDGSGRSGAFLDARGHLLQDPAAEAKLGFSLAHAWGAAQQGLLLRSTAVLLTPGVLRAQAAIPAVSSGNPFSPGEMWVSKLRARDAALPNCLSVCECRAEGWCSGVGLLAAEADKGEGLRMLVGRAGGQVAGSVAQLDASGAAQVGLWSLDNSPHACIPKSGIGQEACITVGVIIFSLDGKWHASRKNANANEIWQSVSSIPMVTWQVVILGNEKDIRKEQAWAKRTCKGTFPVIGRSEFVNALLQQRLNPAASAMFVT